MSDGAMVRKRRCVRYTTRATVKAVRKAREVKRSGVEAIRKVTSKTVAAARIRRQGGGWTRGREQVAEHVERALETEAAHERMWCRKKSSAAHVWG